MKRISYFAVLEGGEEEGYGISFPDVPGCFSMADNLTEAREKAKEALELHFLNLERDGEELPAPSLYLSGEGADRIILMPIPICMKGDC